MYKVYEKSNDTMDNQVLSWRRGLKQIYKEIYETIVMHMILI